MKDIQIKFKFELLQHQQVVIAPATHIFFFLFSIREQPHCHLVWPLSKIYMILHGNKQNRYSLIIFFILYRHPNNYRLQEIPLQDIHTYPTYQFLKDTPPPAPIKFGR